MSKHESTKKLLADTMKKLAAKKNLDKISISELVEAAGLNRQTFYYHFQDKQELIWWIFDYDFAHLKDKKNHNILLDDLIEHMYLEKDFYIDAIASDAQNNLRTHMYEVCNNRCAERLKQILGDRHMDEKYMDMVVGIYTNAVVGTLAQWMQKGMAAINTDFLDDYASFMIELLEFAADKFGKGQH